MAFASVGQITSGNSSTANQASIAINNYNSAALTANTDLLILIVAMDNNQTTDGDEGAISSITDASGNVWSKAAEFTNGQGGAQSGATCSIWYCPITVGVAASAGSITINLTNSTSRDKTAWTMWKWTKSSSAGVSVSRINTLANDGTPSGNEDFTGTVSGTLAVHGIATESSTTTAITTGTGWTAYTQSVTAGGGSASNMGVRGEWKISPNEVSGNVGFSADHATVFVSFVETNPTAKPFRMSGSRFFRIGF